MTQLYKPVNFKGKWEPSRNIHLLDERRKNREGSLIVISLVRPLPPAFGCTPIVMGYLELRQDLETMRGSPEE